MSELTAAFAELVRRAAVQRPRPRGETAVGLRLFCQHCNAEQLHRLARETDLDEIYECCHCGNQVTYRVR